MEKVSGGKEKGRYYSLDLLRIISMLMIILMHSIDLDAWRKIAQYNSSNSLTLEDEMDATGTETTKIVTMNELTFDGFSLTQLDLKFAPRMR